MTTYEKMMSNWEHWMKLNVAIIVDDDEAAKKTISQYRVNFVKYADEWLEQQRYAFIRQHKAANRASDVETIANQMELGTYEYASSNYLTAQEREAKALVAAREASRERAENIRKAEQTEIEKFTEYCDKIVSRYYHHLAGHSIWSEDLMSEAARSAFRK